ncbi:MAG: potassium channel protein [Sedimentisphaerales bacterium]|nr:potassium channel protein [Sedimentisphaerales bacterium]
MSNRDRQTFSDLRGLYVAMGILLFVVALGVAGFMFLEKTSFLDALYMTLVTISTLGMKADSLEHIGEPGKVLVMVLIVVGIVAAMAALSSIVGFVVEGHMRSILGRRKVNMKIASLQNHIIVCGYGRMGSAVCASLQRRGTSLVVIDKSDENTLRAETNGLLYVLGDASEEAILRDAGIERAKGLVSVLPTDADNVFVTLVARNLNAKLLIAGRAERPQSEARLLQAGANKVICPHIIGASRLVNILTRPGVVDFLDFAFEGLELEAEQVQVKTEGKLSGKSLREANLPREVGILVIALKRADGSTLFNPPSDTILQAGDVMVVTGRAGSMARLHDFC